MIPSILATPNLIIFLSFSTIFLITVSIMENVSVAQHVVGIPVKSARRLLSSQKFDLKDLQSTRISNGSSLTKQLRLGPKIAEYLKSNLSLGKNILQLGLGTKKVFKMNFNVMEGEELVKGFRCYMSTTAGPIAGFLFISTHKVCFCSHKCVFKFPSPNGEQVKIHYKVSIPLLQLKKSQDVNIASKNYIEMVTIDDFDFWFMGFRNHQRTIEYLQQAIS